MNCIKTDAAIVERKKDDMSHNYRLRFLILLPASDYEKYLFFSYKDVLWYNRSRFPGLLTIEKFEDADQLPYNIEEPVMPRQLYIMLPKERMYVPSDCFTGRYIRSKMRELVQIFIALRATSIKYVRYDSEKISKTTHVDFSLSDFSQSEGVQLKSVDTKRTGVQYEIRLKKPKEEDDEEEEDEEEEKVDINIFSHSSFYYLKREPAWIDMVSRRIEGGVIYDKYTYWNKEMKLLKGKFIQQLKCLDLSVEYDWKNYNDFMVDYEVSY
jgi:hypothetical protein